MYLNSKNLMIVDSHCFSAEIGFCRACRFQILGEAFFNIRDGGSLCRNRRAMDTGAATSLTANGEQRRPWTESDETYAEFAGAKG